MAKILVTVNLQWKYAFIRNLQINETKKLPFIFCNYTVHHMSKFLCSKMSITDISKNATYILY